MSAERLANFQRKKKLSSQFTKCQRLLTVMDIFLTRAYKFVFKSYGHQFPVVKVFVKYTANPVQTNLKMLSQTDYQHIFHLLFYLKGVVGKALSITYSRLLFKINFHFVISIFQNNSKNQPKISYKLQICILFIVWSNLN